MMGGHLVAIDSESEYKWIYERMDNYTNFTGKYSFPNISKIFIY